MVIFPLKMVDLQKNSSKLRQLRPGFPLWSSGHDGLQLFAAGALVRASALLRRGNGAGAGGADVDRCLAPGHGVGAWTAKHGGFHGKLWETMGNYKWWFFAWENSLIADFPAFHV